MQIKLKNITIEYEEFTKRSQLIALGEHAKKMEEIKDNEVLTVMELLKVLSSILITKIETADNVFTDKTKFFDDVLDRMNLVDDEDLSIVSTKLMDVLNKEFEKRNKVTDELKKNHI